MRWVGGVDQDGERIVERNWRRQVRNMDECEKQLRKPGPTRGCRDDDDNDDYD
jgi:hypothetical protein